MKIIQVSDTYYPIIGGIPDHIFFLSRELRKRGHTVKILSTRFGENGEDDVEDVARIGRGIPIRANKSIARITLGWRLSDKVQRLLMEFNPDIVHVHGSLAPMLPILALRHSKAINVFTFHAGHENALGYIFFKNWLMPYWRKLHGLVAVSQTAEYSMSRYFKGNYTIIPNGVNIDDFRPGIKPLPEFSDGRQKILFMNRLEPRKGLPYLLRALKYVKKRIPNVLLIVAGSGPYSEYYKSMVDSSMAQNVVFVGQVPGTPSSLRASYYSSCDLLCVPSIGHESFGIVILEGMACAKPVVASRIEGFRHVLKHGEEGLFFPAKDERGLANAILTILTNEDLAKKMGKIGRKKACHYSWKKIAAKVEHLYKVLRREIS